MLMICWAYYFQGKLRQAVDTARQMIQIGEEGSDRQVVVWGLTGLGTSQMRLGLMDEAISSLQQAKRVAEAMPDYSGQVTAGSWLGRCYAAIGNLELALSVLEASQAIELAHPGSSSYVYLKNGLSLAYLTAAERSTGQVKQAWLQKAQRAGRKALQAAKRNRPALPDAHLFWGRYQWLRGKPALARKSWARALAQAERIGDPYMEGVIHLEIGQRLGDGDHLQQAESLLEAIDAEFDLAAAREAQAESMETTDKNSRLERRQLGRDG
jgi:tetratricopeptide (TPR) repeat protein